jgi:hypothetical protein
MKRVCKHKDSTILQNKWQYKNNNAVHNRKIRTVLEKEQKYFCAYTEDRFSATYARDIEHFNPNLKYTNKDSYKNWFAVSNKFNKDKGTKWETFQPIMHPTDINFEKRLWYSAGMYEVNSTDIRADNLRKYLDLNNPLLVKERMEYIKGLKSLGDNDFVKEFLNENPTFIKFPRAIETEFNIKF